MTQQECFDLKVGDKVYYYRKICVLDLRTFTAVIKEKVINNINAKYDAEIGSMYITKASALKQKLIDMRNAIKSMKPIYEYELKVLNYKGPTTAKLKERYSKILHQKNIKIVIEKYPEIFI